MRIEVTSTLAAPVGAGSYFLDPGRQTSSMPNTWQVWITEEVQALLHIMARSPHLELLMGSSCQPNRAAYMAIRRRLARRGFRRTLPQIRSKVKAMRNAFYRIRRLFHGHPPPEGRPPFYAQWFDLWERAGRPDERRARRPAAPAVGQAMGRVDEREARPAGAPGHQEEEEEVHIPAGRQEEQFPPMEGQEGAIQEEEEGKEQEEESAEEQEEDAPRPAGREAALDAEEQEEEQEDDLAIPAGMEEEEIPPVVDPQGAIEEEEEEEEAELELADFPQEPDGEEEPPLRQLVGAIIRRLGEFERRLDAVEIWVRHFRVAGTPPR